jgi:isopentenyl-diphosphate Delta-isomerase
MANTKTVTKPEELWQGYEEDGEPITAFGIPIQSAAKGALHGSAHLWIYRVKNGQLQVLLQKRSAKSKTWPNYYDISAAGHINFRETPLTAALRETEEELGIKIVPETVRLLFLHRQVLRYTPRRIIENELQWVYGFDATHTPHFSLESSEVTSVLWVNLDGLSKLLLGKVKGMHIVPHDSVYFAEMVRELLELKREYHGYQSAS